MLSWCRAVRSASVVTFAAALVASTFVGVHGAVPSRPGDHQTVCVAGVGLSHRGGTGSRSRSIEDRADAAANRHGHGRAVSHRLA